MRASPPTGPSDNLEALQMGGRIVISPLNVDPSKGAMFLSPVARTRHVLGKAHLRGELCCVLAPLELGMPPFLESCPIYTSRAELEAAFDQSRPLPSVFSISLKLLQNLLDDEEWDLPSRATAIPRLPGSKDEAFVGFQEPLVETQTPRPLVPVRRLWKGFNGGADRVIPAVSNASEEVRAGAVETLAPLLDVASTPEQQAFDRALEALEAILGLPPQFISPGPLVSDLFTLSKHPAFFKQRGPGTAHQRVVKVVADLTELNNAKKEGYPGIEKTIFEVNKLLASLAGRR